MATQRYSVTPQSIDTLLAWVKSGEIAVPEIQRPFVWDATKVRNLLDSLYQGYPVGYLIAWQNPSVRLKDGSKSSGKRILIDGQQRVTALMAALLGREVLTKDYETVTIRIAFHPIEERFEVSNPAIRKDSAWIPDIATVFDPNVSLTKLTREYAERNADADQDEVSLVLERVRKITNNHVGVINLDEDLDIETVTEIFIRVNSAGASLSQADFAMSKIAVNETHGGNMLRKAIDYFCHLAVAPEFFPRIEKFGQGIRCVRIPAEDAMAQGRQRRPLRSHLYGHASSGVHVGIPARQAAGPGRAAVRPQFRDQAIRRRDRRGCVRPVEDRHLQLHEQDSLRPADDDHTLGRFRHVEADRQPERRQLRLHPVSARPGRGDAGRRHRAPRPALVRHVAVAQTILGLPGDDLRLRHPADRRPRARQVLRGRDR